MSFTRSQLQSLLPTMAPANRAAVERQLAIPAPSVLPIEPIGSPLEVRFLRLWLELDGPKLEREVKFCDTRKFRLDFAHAYSMVAIEIDGATMAGVRGGHTSKAGYYNGACKLNLATVMGWRCFRLTGAMITAEHVKPIIELCMKDEAGNLELGVR